MAKSSGLPVNLMRPASNVVFSRYGATKVRSLTPRSEEHTSELQSRRDLVCRLLLEKKKRTNKARGLRLRNRWPARRVWRRPGDSTAWCCGGVATRPGRSGPGRAAGRAGAGVARYVI